MELSPTILRVPGHIQSLHGRARGQALSQLARACLAPAWRVLDIAGDHLRQDGSRRPLPYQGIHWSVSHKPEYVCGVLWRDSVGIDTEKIKDFNDGLFDKIANAKEWEEFRERNNETFAKLFSAKEAVLKANGLGITAIKKCLLVEISRHELRLKFGRSSWWVSQIALDHHLFSLARRQRASKPAWLLMNAQGTCTPLNIQ